MSEVGQIELKTQNRVVKLFREKLSYLFLVNEEEYKDYINIEQYSRIFTYIETEIEQLEAQLAKYRQMKVGMMQELLTGKKRLV